MPLEQNQPTTGTEHKQDSPEPRGGGADGSEGAQTKTGYRIVPSAPEGHGGGTEPTPEVQGKTGYVHDENPPSPGQMSGPTGRTDEVKEI